LRSLCSHTSSLRSSSNPIGDVFILRFDMFDIPADDNGGGSSIGAARLPPFALCKQYVLLSGFARSE